MSKLRFYKFVIYENNFDDTAFLSKTAKLPLNLVYAVDDLAEKVHIFNKLFSQTLGLYFPSTRIKFTHPPTQQLRDSKH